MGMGCSSRGIAAGVLGCLMLAGCGEEAVSVAAAPLTESRNVQVSATFTAEVGTAITYDPVLVAVGGRGAVSSQAAAGRTTVLLAVRGVEPNRQYGAHAHAEPCGPTGDAAGPHFQNVVDPVQPSVDPQYANPDNEIWLDLTTDASGSGSAEASVNWEFPVDRRARSVILHAMPTATDPGRAGSAGARAACISVDF